MNLYTKFFSLTLAVVSASTVLAELPFDLSITGKQFDLNTQIHTA